MKNKINIKKDIKLKLDVIELNLNNSELISLLEKQIFSLLKENKLDTVEKQEISLLVNEKKDIQEAIKYKSMDWIKEFKAKWWDNYIKILDSIKETILNMFDDNQNKEKIEESNGEKKTFFGNLQNKLWKEEEKEENDKKIDTDDIEQKSIKNKIEKEKIRKEKKQVKKKIEHPEEMKEYFAILQEHLNTDISNISRDNYHSKLETISFKNTTEKKLEELVQALQWFKEHTKYWRYKGMNSDLIEYIEAKIERIKNNKINAEKVAIDIHNSKTIKWITTTLIPQLQKFKNNVNKKIRSYKKSPWEQVLKDIQSTLKEEYDEIIIFVKDKLEKSNLKWDKQSSIKLTFSRKIDYWLDIYKDMSINRIKLWIDWWFILWDADSLINELKKEWK